MSKGVVVVVVVHESQASAAAGYQVAVHAIGDAANRQACFSKHSCLPLFIRSGSLYFANQDLPVYLD